MIGVIERGKTPAAVLEVYVFGSYVRGALEPNDLDMVVVHERPSEELIQQYRDELFRTRKSWFDDITEPGRRFEAKMRNALKHRGEKIDLLLSSDPRSLQQGIGVPDEEFLLIWSPEKRDWREAINAIVLNPEAGTAERHQFIAPKRIASSRAEVRNITEMLDRGELALARFGLEDIIVKLSANYQHWLDWWTECSAMGKRAVKCLPYGMWWMQQERAGTLDVSGPELINKRRTRRVQMGNLRLGEMQWYFGKFPKMKKQCLIPHIKRNEINELLVFERGSNWGNRKK